MQAIMESLFDVVYLAVTLILGVVILRRASGRREALLFGVMTLVLVCGDAFHLVPRIWALNTTGTENHVAALGFGTLVTSITITAFYVLLYHVWRLRYGVQGKTGLTAAVYILAVVRVALCLFPQNKWLSADAPLAWGIYRNIPFAVLGVLIIVLFYRMAKKQGDKPFRFMWLAITLSFLFYAPVVLFAGTVPLVGMLMMPKTCAYVWMVWMGLKAYKSDRAA